MRWSTSAVPFPLSIRWWWGILQKSAGVRLLISADNVRFFYYEGLRRRLPPFRPSGQGSTKGGATYCPLFFSATQTMANPRAINFAKATTLAAAHILDICLAASCLLGWVLCTYRGIRSRHFSFPFLLLGCSVLLPYFLNLSVSLTAHVRGYEGFKGRISLQPVRSA